MRVLCLHGKGTSGAIFKSQTCETVRSLYFGLITDGPRAGTPQLHFGRVSTKTSSSTGSMLRMKVTRLRESICSTLRYTILSGRRIQPSMSGKLALG